MSDDNSLPWLKHPWDFSDPDCRQPVTGGTLAGQYYSTGLVGVVIVLHFYVWVRASFRHRTIIEEMMLFYALCRSV